MVGGLDQVEQSRVLASRPHVVVATPGRLAELISLKVVSLSKLSWLILDEADRLLSLGFQEQLQGSIAGFPILVVLLIFFLGTSHYCCLSCKASDDAVLCDDEPHDQGFEDSMVLCKLLTTFSFLKPCPCEILSDTINWQMKEPCLR